MTPEQIIERGRQAESVLDNPVYRDAYEQIEQGLTRAWQESRNRDEREELHQLHRALAKVRATMEAAMRTGRVEAEKLRHKQTLAQRIGRRLSSD